MATKILRFSFIFKFFHFIKRIVQLDTIRYRDKMSESIVFDFKPGQAVHLKSTKRHFEVIKAKIKLRWSIIVDFV